MQMNKKASEKINAVMLILYLVIIAGGVTILISSYVNTPVDVRSMEAQILYERLMNCFAKDGFLKENVLDVNFDVFSSCYINKTVIGNSNIYFEFIFLNETGVDVRNKIIGGDLVWIISKKNDCEVYLGRENEKSPSCLFKNETYLYTSFEGVKNVKIVGWVSCNNQGVRNA